MTFLIRAFSWSYVRRHRIEMALAILGVAAGVATFSSIRVAQASLVGGLRTTVDRIAGKAQLQVSGVGGVPESLEADVRDVPGVRALTPVIEEVVQIDPPGRGGALVLGIDLIGDRDMREYGFEGADADLDDPLLFLAQPDSVAVSGDWARRAGVALGDALTIRVRSATRRLVVRALLDSRGFAGAFGGAVFVTDVYSAQQILGRGRRFDRLDVRGGPDVSVDDLEQRIRQRVGAGYRVDTPARRGRQMERLIAAFTDGFTVSSLLALGVGVLLIFNTLTVAVERRRREIGILRTLGATSGTIHGLVLVEAAAVGLAGGVGGLLLGGLTAGRFLGLMQQTVETNYGLAESGPVLLGGRLAAESIALGLGAALVGAWIPARAASRTRPTAAIASGAFMAQRAGTPRWQIASAVACGAIAASLVARPVGSTTVLIGLVVLSAGAAIALLVGPAAARLLAFAIRPLQWMAPLSARVAVNSLRSHPRRTAGTTAAITLSLVFTLGVGGYLRSAGVAVSRWTDNVMTADLYVRTSVGFGASAIRLPWTLADDLRRLPGVQAVAGFRNDRLLFQGEEISLVAIDADDTLGRSRQEITQGTPEGLSSLARRGDACLVSDNLARRLRLGIGDRLTLHSPAGSVQLSVVAVVTSFVSDRGTIIVDRSVFTRHWQDDRVDIFQISLDPSASATGVRDAIAARLAGDYPALISTRAEFIRESRRALDDFSTLTRLTIAATFVVALVTVATAVLISVTERRREIGILRALGAVGRQIRRSVVCEALVITACALALAVPPGLILARLLTTTILEASTGYRLPTEYPTDVFAVLLVTLPLLGALAAWVPARHASAILAREALTHE